TAAPGAAPPRLGELDGLPVTPAAEAELRIELGPDRPSPAERSIELLLRANVRTTGTQREPDPAEDREVERESDQHGGQRGGADRSERYGHTDDGRNEDGGDDDQEAVVVEG